MTCPCPRQVLPVPPDRLLVSTGVLPAMVNFSPFPLVPCGFRRFTPGCGTVLLYSSWFGFFLFLLLHFTLGLQHRKPSPERVRKGKKRKKKKQLYFFWGQPLQEIFATLTAPSEKHTLSPGFRKAFLPPRHPLELSLSCRFDFPGLPTTIAPPPASRSAFHRVLDTAAQHWILFNASTATDNQQTHRPIAIGLSTPLFSNSPLTTPPLEPSIQD